MSNEELSPDMQGRIADATRHQEETMWQRWRKAMEQVNIWFERWSFDGDEATHPDVAGILVLTDVGTIFQWPDGRSGVLPLQRRHLIQCPGDVLLKEVE